MQLLSKMKSSSEFLDSHKFHRLSSVLLNSDIFLLLLCLAITILYSSLERPIWIDEFLHFALGSHHSTAEAWDSISSTLVTFNHGQTGVYMLLNYWLLSFFGANAFWLRFPSIISGFILLLASVYLMRLWKLPYIWQVIGILAFLSQVRLMYFTGEARPYIQLATASVCTLFYYSLPYPCRQKIIFRAFGFFSIMLGVLFHPYFSAYWLAIFLFTYIQKYCENSIRRFSFQSLLLHADIKLSVLGSTSYFILASLTWLRGRPSFGFDPFQWIKKDEIVRTFFEFSHFQFLAGFIHPFLAILIASLIASLLLVTVAWIRRKPVNPQLANLLFPLCLILVSLGISVLLSLISYFKSYWIFERQWVASIALVTLGSIWFAYNLSKLVGSIHGSLAIVWTVIISIPILMNSYEFTQSKLPAVIQVIRSNSAAETSEHFKLKPSLESILNNSNLIKKNDWNDWEKLVYSNNDDWVRLANSNLRLGGEVWDVFRVFYGKDVDNK
jgi:hypothetical protein